MVEAADIASKDAGKMTNPEYLSYLCDLCGQCIVDENGNQIFEGRKADFLTGKNFAVTQRIGNKICEMNGLNAKGIEEKKSD